MHLGLNTGPICPLEIKMNILIMVVLVKKDSVGRCVSKEFVFCRNLVMCVHSNESCNKTQLNKLSL